MHDKNLKAKSTIKTLGGVESDNLLNIINKLRFLMIRCRIESRISLDEACKLIQVDKKKSARFFIFAHGLCVGMAESFLDFFNVQVNTKW